MEVIKDCKHCPLKIDDVCSISKARIINNKPGKMCPIDFVEDKSNPVKKVNKANIGNKPYDDEKVLRELYDNGMTLNEIAKLFNVTIYPISERFKKFGIKIRNKNEQIKLYRRKAHEVVKYKRNHLKLHNDRDWLYEQYIILGTEYKEIAKLAGVSVKTISSRIKEFEIPLRGVNTKRRKK